MQRACTTATRFNPNHMLTFTQYVLGTVFFHLIWLQSSLRNGVKVHLSPCVRLEIGYDKICNKYGRLLHIYEDALQHLSIHNARTRKLGIYEQNGKNM